MTLSPRDRRALTMLLIGVPGVLLVSSLFDQKAPDPVQATRSVPRLEQQVRMLRRTAAGLATREQTRKLVAAALDAREKGMIRAETAAQAQAQMLQVVRRVLRAQNPPIDFRASEMGQPRRINETYGEVLATISFDCGIEQVLNLLADLGNQPELIATKELSFGAATNKQKSVPVRLMIGAIVDPKLIPERKEGQPF